MILHVLSADPAHVKNPECVMCGAPWAFVPLGEAWTTPDRTAPFVANPDYVWCNPESGSAAVADVSDS